MVDSMAVAASTFKPTINLKLRYEIELRLRISIADNVKHWQVFEDDEQINNFLTMIENFEDSEIDQESEQTDQNEDLKNLKKSIGDQKIIQLKDNILPKGLVPLKILFDSNDVALDQKKVSQEGEMEDCNLGT